MGEHDEPGKTGYDRTFDAYFVNDTNWGIRAIKLDYSRANDLRKTVESEAFELYDVSQASDRSWRFLAVCQFPERGYEETREFAEAMFRLVGAQVFDFNRELEDEVVPLVQAAVH
jgi:hypothetical protein